MEQIIVGRKAVLTFNIHQAILTEMLTFKGHNQDREVIQHSVIHQEAQTQGYRIIELQGIQVLISPQEVQAIVIPAATDPIYNILPADHPEVQIQADPAVQIHDLLEIQTIVQEEDIDLPLIFPFINWHFYPGNILPF